MLSSSVSVTEALAYIALGSNLGASLTIMRQAASALEQLGQVKARSSLYETAPVGGPEGQANYLNAVIALATSLGPKKLLAELLKIESQFGRERRVRWDARTLDLDLLSFADLVYQTEALTLPHPRMLERAFVLLPLLEIAPDWQHPQTKQNLKEVLAPLAKTGIIKTNFSWQFNHD